jgi:PKD repeat protein
MHTWRTRLRSSVVTSTVAAGLVLTSMTSPAGATAPASATAAPTTAAAQAGPLGSTRGKAAPSALGGQATDFLFYVYPDPQPLCPLLVALNTTEDPSVDRGSCILVNFSTTDASGAVKADFYGDGEDTAFLTDVLADPDTDPGTYQVSASPDATWPAGKIRMVVKDAVGPIGELAFFHNALRGTATAEAPKAPGEAFTVTGTLVEHSKRGSFGSDKGVPATYKIRLTKSDGEVLFTSPQQTAAADGTFSYAVPAGTTTPVTSTAATNYRATLKVDVVDASYTDAAAIPPPATGLWGSKVAASTSQIVVTPATELSLENSFVSSVGWVKPGETYPSRIIVTNPTSGALTPTIDLSAPTGSTFLSASGPGTHPVAPSAFTWSPGSIAPGATAQLVLESKAAPLSGAGSLDTIVWRDLSSTAVMHTPSKPDRTVTSHGPKVIPPSENYDTARYGDRPFPVVPVQYTDRPYQDNHSGSSLESVINDPDNPGSTYNLFQEMSLGQLFPNGTVPSEGIASADFDYAPGFEFTGIDNPNTCHGTTYADLPVDVAGTPLYPERITNGVYNLPGQTEYYGSDTNGSRAYEGQLPLPVALSDIDGGCGDTGKLVYDAAAIADPEIDYSDYDTDKDGVVDFFMVVFAGCGGNGGSQFAAPGDPIGACPYDEVPYDNIWPHSSTLEAGYTDPVTGLPGFTTDDQLKNLEGQPLWYTDDSYSAYTTTDKGDALKVFVRVGPYNVNPETAIDKASVISHEYGHSLGLPDFYSTSERETYGDWNLMATDKSQNIDAFGRQELGWVVPEVLDSSRVETGIPDSKVDTGTIRWQKADGTPYTLTDGPDGTVHNSKMYVAKLPGRTLLDAAAFDSGDKASKSHLWWSGSGNDFNCTPVAGHNLDFRIPGLAGLTDDATVTLSFKSRWDIEWDYDYAFVMTTTDGGKTYTSHESANGYTTGTNTIPPAASKNACQDTYSNGLTGSSGSYGAGTEAVDRLTDSYPEPVFLEDSYDISDLAGAAGGALRFSYATDPGLARPGWFIDDLKVTVDPDGSGPTAPHDVYATDFETSGGPTDPAVFNGGCQGAVSTAQKCTQGFKYLTAGAASEQDHAYYLEMRDRSGFDFEGHGQIDRDPLGFQPGFYLSYTDEAHGYGNAGTDDPPAQSPLDSVPQVGENAPNLDDAAFRDVTGRATYSDAYVAGDATKKGHTDNYLDPSSPTGNWEFRYNCLGFQVDSMTGEDTVQLAGDLTGAVTFTMGSGCGEFDYGYTAGGGGGANTAPVADAKATPSTVEAGTPVTLSAAASTDAETPDDLDYSWDFGNGGTTKDAATRNAKVTYTKAGTYTAKVTVTDPQGLSDTATVLVTVKDTKPVAKLRIKPKKPFITTRVRLDGSRSTGAGLKYSWSFGDGGTTKDASGKVVTTTFKKPGYRTVRLTVTDSKGRTSTTKQRILVRRAVSCNARSVARTGSWRVVSSPEAPKGDYCDNLGRGAGQDTLTYRFTGPQLDVYFGTSTNGGQARLYVDGVSKGVISFRGTEARPRFRGHKLVTGLSKGRHTVRLVVLGGTAYLDSFITIR